MIRINLLPHREQKRRERRQQFFALIGLMVLVGALAAVVVHTLIAGAVERQEGRNEFLKQEIALLDKEIAEIKRLREQVDSLLARKQVIESLQTRRGEVVQLFNDMARQMPEGVYLTSVKQSGPRVLLSGYAQSNARVSMLMRNLDGSPSLTDPQLVETKAAMVRRDDEGALTKATANNKKPGDASSARRVSEFTLSVAIERAKSEVEPEGAKK